MKFPDNQIKFEQLRKSYPFFRYENYSYIIKDKTLHIEFSFDYSGKINFKPHITIPVKGFFMKERLTPEYLNNIVFNIGMIELISYWKAGCAPELIIGPHDLSPEQLNWWRKIYYKGLGEFLYVNGIKTDLNEFVHISPAGKEKLQPIQIHQDNSTIVPIGGGKDSIVSIELMKRAGMTTTPLIMNPRGATVSTASEAGFPPEKIIVINRQIHPQLIRLNDKGFLNGHTPFSAMLAFYTILAAILTGKRNIALSNESSANESTVMDTDINHQYSKSFEFEQDFRNYVNRNISRDINYYSFLRPLNELQIASVFSGFKNYFGIFKSCNEGSKNDKWCCSCPKCLFTYIILSPFIEETQLKTIWGKDLFSEPGLKEFFDQLTGTAEIKPFDCVGTIDEINTALCETIRIRASSPLPLLLERYKNQYMYLKYKNNSFSDMMSSMHPHFLDEENFNIIKGALTL